MKDKKTFYTIIVLMVITIPFAVLGTINHIKTKNANKGPVYNNPNKEDFYNGTVYFYNKDGNLLGVYECASCTKLKSVLDDENYHTRSYRNGTKPLDLVVNDNIAIFNEADKVDYYSISSKNVVLDYDAVKDYKIANNLNGLIAKYQGKWGILDYVNSRIITPYDYDYIAFANHIENDMLNINKIIAKRGNEWYIIDITKDNDSIYMTSKEIVDFNDKYVILYEGSSYKLYDYNNIEYLKDMTKNNVYLAGEYIAVLQNKHVLIYKTIGSTPIDNIELSDDSDVYVTLENDKINVYENGQLFKSVDVK